MRGTLAVPTNAKEAGTEFIDYVGLVAVLLPVFLWFALFEELWAHRGDVGGELRATVEEIIHRR